jgi:hypothetical protein
MSNSSSSGGGSDDHVDVAAVEATLLPIILCLYASKGSSEQLRAVTSSYVDLETTRGDYDGRTALVSY